MKASEAPVQDPTKAEIQDAEEDAHSGKACTALETANQASETALQPDNKALTAAKHTYDVGYKKWDNFDVDAALREVDKTNVPKAQSVKMPLQQDESGARRAHEDPMKALDEAIERMNDTKASQPNNAAESAADNTDGDASMGPCDSTDLPAREPCQTPDASVSAEVGAESAVELCPGDRVEIFGLESERGRSLNGSIGLVEGLDEESGRVKIRVASAAASSQIL